MFITVSGGERGKQEDMCRVVKDATSRGLCVRVGPPHTNERRAGGEVVSKEVGEERGAQGGVDRRSGFEPQDLDRPGRLPHQQSVCQSAPCPPGPSRFASHTVQLALLSHGAGIIMARAAGDSDHERVALFY